ncbi:hypothetical protein WDW37_13025 [Bdellovibrionota bacterium FG-1]
MTEAENALRCEIAQQHEQALRTLLEVGQVAEAVICFLELDLDNRRLLLASEKLNPRLLLQAEALFSREGKVKMKRIGAALAAWFTASEKLQSGLSSSNATLSELEPHRELLADIPEGVNLLAQLEAIELEAARQRAGSALCEMEALLKRGEVFRAESLFREVRQRDLGAEEQTRWASLGLQLSMAVKVRSLENRHEQCIMSRDWFGARDSALELSRMVANEDLGKHWTARVAHFQLELHREWKLEVFSEDICPPDLFNHIPDVRDSWAVRCIDPSGRIALFFSGWGQWGFLATVDIASGRVFETVTFRGPVPLNIISYAFDGARLTLVGETGVVLRMSRDPHWKILDFRSVAGLLPADDKIENAVTDLGGRYLWLMHGGRPRLGARTSVIDLDQGQLLRSIGRDGFPIILEDKGEIELLLGPIGANRVELLDFRGRKKRSVELGANQEMSTGLRHPVNGELLLCVHNSLPFWGPSAEAGENEEREEDEEDLEPWIGFFSWRQEGLVEVMRIRGADGEGMHAVAGNSTHGLVFINCIRGEEWTLCALTPEDDHLKPLFEVPSTDRLMLFESGNGKHALAVLPQRSSVRLIPLDGKPIAIEADEVRLEFPDFSGLFIAEGESFREWKSSSLAYSAMIQNLPPLELARWFEAQKLRNVDDPDSAFAAYLAHERTPYSFERSPALLDWMWERYPGHPGIGIERAKRLIRDADPSTARETLESVLEATNPANPPAWYGLALHLLGMACYLARHFERAFGIWHDNSSYSGMDRKPFLELEAFTRQASQGEPAPKPASLLGEVLFRVMVADRLITADDFDGAHEVLEPLFRVDFFNIQIHARIVACLLRAADTSPRRQVSKRYFLAKFCVETFSRSSNRLFDRPPVLPPPLDTWPTERIAALRREAESWLQGDE